MTFLAFFPLQIQYKSYLLRKTEKYLDNMIEGVMIVIVIASVIFILYEFLKIRKVLKKNSKFYEILQKYETKKLSLNPNTELETLESKLSELKAKVNDQEKTIKKLMTEPSG